MMEKGRPARKSFVSPDLMKFFLSLPYAYLGQEMLFQLENFAVGKQPCVHGSCSQCHLDVDSSVGLCPKDSITVEHEYLDRSCNPTLTFRSRNP